MRCVANTRITRTSTTPSPGGAGSSIGAPGNASSSSGGHTAVITAQRDEPHSASMAFAVITAARHRLIP
jgi:hypothetical protein